MIGPYESYCASVNKTAEQIPRQMFNTAYSLLTETFKRVTGRLGTPPREALYIIFAYVTDFMHRIESGDVTQERLGDYSYVRQSITLSAKLSEFEMAIQPFVGSAPLPVGMSTESDMLNGCHR